MTYRFVGYTLDKKIEQGTIDATSESTAEEALYRTGYHRILSLRELRPGLSLEKLIPTLFGIKAGEVIDFSRELATLIESGITILTALQLLEEQVSRTAFRRVIAGLVKELWGGSSFSQALSKYPQAFSHTYCHVIGATEQAGNLEAGLRQVADYMEKQTATKKRVSQAMAYPAVVLLMAIGVFALLITVALPPLVELFNRLGATLPWMTRLVITIAAFFIDYRLHLLGAILALITFFVSYKKLPMGKLAMDRLMLKIPVIGLVNLERNMCYFCQTASMLMKAGLPLHQIIDIATQTIGNRIIRHALRDFRERLVQGQGVSQSMATIDLFPRFMVEMVVVGEKTGTLDSTFVTLAEYYEKRVSQKISTLISVIEPSLTVVIGLVVAFIALSMITPLYSILRSM